MDERAAAKKKILDDVRKYAAKGVAERLRLDRLPKPAPKAAKADEPAPEADEPIDVTQLEALLQ